jgi:hypothetical protein
MIRFAKNSDGLPWLDSLISGRVEVALPVLA